MSDLWVAGAVGEPLVPDANAGLGRGMDLTGFFYLAAVVVTWVSQSEVAQFVQTSSYNQPMTITWLNHSVGVLVFPIILACGGSFGKSYSALTKACSPQKLFLSALLLAIVYLAADWLWYVGLPYTSVAAGTTIFNTSSCWVYLLSLLMGNPHRRIQTVALALCSLGILAVCYQPGSNNVGALPESSSEQLYGNVIVMLAAMGYAVYDVFFEKALAHVQGLDAFITSSFVSFCSLLTAVLLWPAVVAEAPEFPSVATLKGLCINATLATCFNIFFALALVRTSPLLTAVACMLTVPVSLAVDSVAHGDRFGAVELTGSMLVAFGFFTLALDKPKSVS